MGRRFPAGYVLSRFRFPGKSLVDAVLDIPIVLPPLVIGLALLILFQTPLGRAVERVVPVTFAVPSVILAQFTVACAFAVRTMRVTFDQISPRSEQVALTLGCTPSPGLLDGRLPRGPARRCSPPPRWPGPARWASSARSSSSPAPRGCAPRCCPPRVFLELSVGNIEAAAAVSLVMVVAALVVLIAGPRVRPARHRADLSDDR